MLGGIRTCLRTSGDPVFPYISNLCSFQKNYRFIAKRFCKGTQKCIHSAGRIQTMQSETSLIRRFYFLEYRTDYTTSSVRIYYVHITSCAWHCNIDAFTELCFKLMCRTRNVLSWRFICFSDVKNTWHGGNLIMYHFNSNKKKIRNGLWTFLINEVMHELYRFEFEVEIFGKVYRSFSIKKKE